MKIVKSSNKLVISKEEWINLGKTAGWLTQKDEFYGTEASIEVSLIDEVLINEEEVEVERTYKVDFEFIVENDPGKTWGRPEDGYPPSYHQDWEVKSITHIKTYVDGEFKSSPNKKIELESISPEIMNQIDSEISDWIEDNGEKYIKKYYSDPPDDDDDYYYN
jgi:hypothetical protein